MSTFFLFLLILNTARKLQTKLQTFTDKVQQNSGGIDEALQIHFASVTLTWARAPTASAGFVRKYVYILFLMNIE